MASLRKALLAESVDLSEHLYDLVNIRFRARGRIRFHLDFVGDEILSDSLRRELHRIESVALEAYSSRTRCALISYDHKKTTELAITIALLQGIKQFARVHGECDLSHHHHENSKNFNENHSGDCAHDHALHASDAGIRKELFKLALSGSLLGYFIYRKVTLKSAFILEKNFYTYVISLITILSGYPIFSAGYKTVQKDQKATDDTLISIAVIATILMGESLTGLSVVWLINLGKLLEAITLKRSRTAIRELMDRTPTEGWLVESEEIIKKISVEKIHKGQRLKVFSSEKVPLDGKILSGTALIQEAFITGEAIPKEKSTGESVYAGSVVLQGEIDIEVTNLVHDTVVARIIDAIENLRDQKAPIEKVGARFAGQFVPISLSVAALTLLVTGDIKRAITMLVIACPCAAGLATPTAVSSSIGQAARKGLLIKGGTHIEMAAKIDTLVFDKTGTLTLGRPIFQKFVNFKNSADFLDCLRLAASAEQYTTHPLAAALIDEARKKGLTLAKICEHESFPGMEIRATILGQSIHVGNEKFFKFLKAKIPKSFARKAAENFIAGESIMYMAINGQLQGAFLVQDQVREEAYKMLKNVQKLGVKRVLLSTGDQQVAADFVAKQLGIKEVHAELFPEDKLNLITKLKAQGHKVAMIGDGVNDAEAFTAADLSIAMGGGQCDVAIEAADITLARSDLMLVAEALDISQKTIKTIYQNFAASVGINAAGLIVSSLGRLSPFMAALVHNASTIAVVLNSFRLGKQVAQSNLFETLKEVSI